MSNVNYLINTILNNSFNKYERPVWVPEVENMPRFGGGLVGYFGYDAVRTRCIDAAGANGDPNGHRGNGNDGRFFRPARANSHGNI